jgi:hypothetical protein
LLHVLGKVFHMLWPATCSAAIRKRTYCFSVATVVMQMYHNVMLYVCRVSRSHLHCHSYGTHFRMHTVLLPCSLPFFVVCIYFQLHTAAFKSYCAIWVRCSNFCHQASPCVSPRESTQRQKVELWARNVW